MEKLESSFGDYLPLIPYGDHVPDEKYYHSLFHMAVAILNLKVRSEEKTSHGLIDIHFRGKNDDNYIIEFKHYS